MPNIRVFSGVHNLQSSLPSKDQAIGLQGIFSLDLSLRKTMGGCSSRNGSKELASFELSEPVLDFDCKEFEFGGVKIVRCAVQGWRKTMEDVALVDYGVSPRKDTLVLGVFDGHSGSEAAEFAREKLLGHITATDEWQRGDVTSACDKGFLSADIAMRKSGITSGTTAVLAFLGPGDITVANCGDSRSVLSRGGRQLPMSIDHKPGRKGERRRILRSGGYLDETDPKHPRVVRDNYNMSIATSRALGDFDFKNDPSRPAEQQMVSPVPEFYTRERTPEDEFLVLASDGVWDVIDNPGMVTFLAAESARLDLLGDNDIGRVESSPESVPLVGNGGSGETKLEALGRSVLRRCYDSGSRDNMTIVIADLRRTKESSERPEPGGGDSIYPSPIQGLVGVGDEQGEENNGHPGCVSTDAGYRGHEDNVPGSWDEDTGQISPKESDLMGRTCDNGTVEFERLSGVERAGFENGDMGMREGKLQLRPPEPSGKETAQAINGS